MNLTLRHPKGDSCMLAIDGRRVTLQWISRNPALSVTRVVTYPSLVATSVALSEAAMWFARLGYRLPIESLKEGP